MTIRELIERLEESAETLGDDTEVRFASQPSWPFEYSISTLVSTADDDPDEDDDEPGESAEPVVYLAEGRQLGYLPGHVSRLLGWR